MMSTRQVEREAAKDAEIDRLRAALQDMIEISTRNSEASLMLIAIRKCAEHALNGSDRKAAKKD